MAAREGVKMKAAQIRAMVKFMMFLEEHAKTVESFGEQEVTFEMDDVNYVFDDVSGEWEELDVVGYLQRMFEGACDLKITLGYENWVTVEFKEGV